MTPLLSELDQLTDDELLATLPRLTGQEFEATARLVAHLAALDDRRLYLQEGFPSLFAWCTQRLHLSEQAAYLRITASRVIRRFPLVLERLAAGRIHLTGISLLAPVLRPDNHRSLLDLASHKSRRQIEALVVRLHAVTGIAARARIVPVPGASEDSRRNTPLPIEVAFGFRPENSDSPGEGWVTGGAGSDSRPVNDPAGLASWDVSDSASEAAGISGAEERGTSAIGNDDPVDPRRPNPAPGSWTGNFGDVLPLPAATSPVAYRLHVTLGADAYEQLRQAQELLRHQVPDGNPGVILARALQMLVTEMLRRKAAITRPSRRQGTPRDLSGPGVTANAEDPGLKTGRPSGPAIGRPVGTPRHPPSRYIPAHVRRAVWRRDGGRCAYRGPGGQRCSARGHLEFHHVLPHARGGPATVQNIQLRCRAHNVFEAEGLAWPRPPVHRPNRPDSVRTEPEPRRHDAPVDREDRPMTESPEPVHLHGSNGEQTQRGGKAP